MSKVKKPTICYDSAASNTLLIFCPKCGIEEIKELKSSQNIRSIACECKNCK